MPLPDCKKRKENRCRVRAASAFEVRVSSAGWPCQRGRSARNITHDTCTQKHELWLDMQPFLGAEWLSIQTTVHKAVAAQSSGWAHGRKITFFIFCDSGFPSYALQILNHLSPFIFVTSLRDRSCAADSLGSSLHCSEAPDSSSSSAFKRGCGLMQRSLAWTCLWPWQ